MVAFRLSFPDNGLLFFSLWHWWMNKLHHTGVLQRNQAEYKSAGCWCCYCCFPRTKVNSRLGFNCWWCKLSLSLAWFSFETKGKNLHISYGTKYGQKSPLCRKKGRWTEYRFACWHYTMSVLIYGAKGITGEQCPSILTWHIHWLLHSLCPCLTVGKPSFLIGQRGRQTNRQTDRRSDGLTD